MVAFSSPTLHDGGTRLVHIVVLVAHSKSVPGSDIKPANVPTGYASFQDGCRYGCQFIVYRRPDTEKNASERVESRPKFGCLACWLFEDVVDTAPLLESRKVNHASSHGPRMVGINDHLYNHLVSNKHFTAVELLTGRPPEVTLWRCLMPGCGRWGVLAGVGARGAT